MDQSLQFRKEAQELLTKAEEELMEPVHALLKEAIDAVGKKRNYAYVLNTDVNAYPYISSDGENCTDAVFVLDDAACPGTIAEIMYANSLQKAIHLFYVRHDDDETESHLHTPCWYPLIFCQQTNPKVKLYECEDLHRAARRVIDFVTFNFNEQQP